MPQTITAVSLGNAGISASPAQIPKRSGYVHSDPVSRSIRPWSSASSIRRALYGAPGHDRARKVERMTDTRALLQRTADIASDFLESLDDRPIFPRTSAAELREALGGALPEGPTDPKDVIEVLAAAADSGIVAMPSGRYFGFVIGGVLPAALAADWLPSTWDQNAGLYVGGLPGLGTPEVVAADDQGRMKPAALRDALRGGDSPTIVCAQAGEVNTGAFDPFDEIADAAAEHGAWLHVDGAFGLWAAASPRLRHFVRGAERADSWITDAHKWLNVPYDSALVLCKDAEAHRAAMTVSASYLIQDDGARAVRDQVDWVPEFSRRARGFAVYAALRSLGRNGLAELGERTCECAQSFAEEVVTLPGVELLNDIVLNQVLFRFASDEETVEVLRRVQDAGDVWMSGTTWNGRRAIRVSVSNWQTPEQEIALALRSFREAAQPAQAPAR